MHKLDMSDDDLLEHVCETHLNDLGSGNKYYFDDESGREFECVDEHWEGPNFCGALWDILPIEKSNAEVIAELQEERNHEEMIKRDGTIQALYPQCAHPTETTSPFEHLGSALLKINGPHNYPGR